MEQKTEDRLSAVQKRTLRLILDGAMLILLVLMYKKQVISISFHEIGGLALIGLFLIHHLVNARWIGAATRRLFSKGTPGMVRARYIVDALLLVAFLAVGITGILISEVVFHIRAAGNFKTLHYFSAALAVLLMGVHLGLHGDYMFGRLLKKGANRAVKIALCVILAAMVAFGGYSLFTTSFVSYLSAPLQASRFAHGAFVPSGDVALDGSNAERPSDLGELPEFSAENGAQPPQDGESRGFGGGSGQGPGGGQGFAGGREGGSTNALQLIAQYVGIIALFAAATYGVVKAAGHKKSRITIQKSGITEETQSDV